MFFPAVVFSSPFFYLFRIFRETFLREREKKKTPRYSIADLASQPVSLPANQPSRQRRRDLIKTAESRLQKNAF